MAEARDPRRDTGSKGLTTRQAGILGMMILSATVFCTVTFSFTHSPSESSDVPGAVSGVVFVVSCVLWMITADRERARRGQSRRPGD